MTSLVDRITAVLAQHHEWLRSGRCVCGRFLSDAHVAERVAAELPELGELEATKLLLAATQELHRRTIADFCAVRDALPRKQVEQILAAVEEKPSGCKHGCTSAAEHRAHGGTPQSRQIGGMP